MKKITKREVQFFFLGILTMFLIESLLDWEGSVKAFKDGWNCVGPKTNKEQVK